MTKKKGRKKSVAMTKDAINPSHYQEHHAGPDVEALQWLESKQYHQRFRNPDKFEGALELQIHKYLDRLGGKDNEVQEITKGAWYLLYYLAWKKNGRKPIRVKNVAELVGKII